MFNGIESISYNDVKTKLISVALLLYLRFRLEPLDHKAAAEL